MMLMLETDIEANPTQDKNIVSWSASEFIAHSKTGGWYGMLAGVSTALTAIIYLLTKDKITAGFVLFGAAALGYFGSRTPKELDYQISSSGVKIGEKQYSFNEFRSFSIVSEGAFLSIIFMPLKRFAPLRAIYFSPEQEDTIVGILSPRLPFEEHRNDVIDRLMDRIRF
jgi:hypothetical protein